MRHYHKIGLHRFAWWQLMGVLIAAVLIIGQPAIASTIRSNRERSLDCTLQVIVETRFGTIRRCTGMLYGSSGFVVAPFHVVADAEAIRVFHVKHGVFEVGRILRVDERTNTALLGLRDWPDAQILPARLGDDTQVPIGDPVYVLHHPATGVDVVHTTTLASRGVARLYPSMAFSEDYAPEAILLEVVGPLDAGSAGGLVCDSDFSVIGLLVASGPLGSDGQRHAYALSATYLRECLKTSYDVDFTRLKTSAHSDADSFDRFFGAAPQRLDNSTPMLEGYLTWFTCINHVSYADAEFTGEINDKIDKNWFYTTELQIDGKPATEISASRFYVCQANRNPWEFHDGANCFVHFDADSLFSKRIYTNRDTEERIMTRYLIAMPLEPGSHALSYENKGANHKRTGMMRKRVDIESGRIQTIDITGLSIVNMQLLPVAPPSIGGAPAVRYEIERRPVLERELNYMIREARIALEL